MFLLHNLAWSTVGRQLHFFLIKDACLRIRSIFQGWIFFFCLFFVNRIKCLNCDWEPGYRGIWLQYKRKCTVSCIMCFLSIVFIQTSFLMKYFLECQQFITSQVCLTCKLLFRFKHFYTFFFSKIMEYNVFTRGCIYPIAYNLAFIYILVY